MRIQLDDLITTTEPELSACSLAELRSVRDAYQDVENGLSYARRIVQGRVDTVSVELERRHDVGNDEDLIQRLPGALAAHSRGPGMPRPIRDMDPPAWTDDVIAELDELLTPTQLGDLDALSDAELISAAARMGDLEQSVSQARHEVHRRIDRVQDELVGRYRSGASVDDLLA